MGVNLTKSRVSGTRGSVYEKITNADVSIYINDQKLAQLSHAGNGNYCLNGSSPDPGSAQYRIIVNVAGFLTVEAAESMIKKFVIRKITTTPFVDNKYLYKKFKINFTVDDGPEDNFYSIKTFLVSAGAKGLVYSRAINAYEPLSDVLSLN